MPTPPQIVPIAQRLLALSLYLGAGPVLLALRRRVGETPFLQHHYGQAAGIFWLFQAALLGALAIVAALSVALVFQRDVYEGSLVETHGLRWAWRLMLAWAVFWAFGAGMALLGAQREMPLVRRLAQRPRLVRGAWALLGAVYVLCLLLLLPLTVHAAHITHGPGHPGRVYMLYEDNGVFPRWIFTLGFYRAARAAEARFGPDAVVVARLSERTMAEALGQAEFVFVGSHGTEEGLLFSTPGETPEHRWLRPEDLRRMAVNPGLQYVYLTGCDSGAMRLAWEDALAPAEVIAFDRLTAVLEHIWWLWFRAPQVIRQL